jgi:hypothetical protein
MVSKMKMALSLVTLAFILFIHGSLQAKTIAGEAALVSELSSIRVNGTEALAGIKKDLSRVQGDYIQGSTKQMIWGDPVGFVQMGNQYLVLSFSASISTPDLKASIFSLLYEMKGSELEYSKNYISWVGPDEMAAYGSISDSSVCALFENLTGTSMCQSGGVSLFFASEIEAKIEDIEAKLEAQSSQVAVKAHTHVGGDIAEGKIQEAFIDDAICRDEELTQAISTITKEMKKQLIPDANAQLEMTSKITEVEELKAQVSELQETVTRLTAILEGVTREGNALVLSGMNVYVVSGKGATDATPNGLGNLIVGYNEDGGQTLGNDNVGSHNLIIGKNNTASSYGGIVAGESNKATAPYATITGGFNNTAGGEYSSVSGGQLNAAKGDYATVGGGLARKAEGNNNWSAGEQIFAK